MSELIPATVAKFGGSSMAKPETVGQIIENRPDQVIIVTSAPGTDENTNEKMTDTLYAYSSLLNKNDPRALIVLDEIVSRYDSLYSSLDSSDRSDLRDSVASALTSPFNKSEAYIVSRGEFFSALYLATLIGLEMEYPQIKFDKNGMVNRNETHAAIQHQVLSSNSNRLIIPGFFGEDEITGELMLLPRGGSDRTGALYASSFDWTYENWTDQDGIFSADPRIISTARFISELTRSEVREGAHGGSGVLQGDTIVDLNGSNLEVNVRNTFNLDNPGTKVLPSRHSNSSEPIVAVSGRKLISISVEDLGMADAKGYVARLVGRAAALGMSIEHMPAAQDAMSFTMHDETSTQQLDEFKTYATSQSISKGSRVEIQNKGVVYAVGESLRDPRIATKVLGKISLLLCSLGLSFDAVVSHPNSPSLAFLVHQEDILPVLVAIHEEFIK